MAGETPFEWHWYNLDRAWISSDPPIHAYSGTLFHLSPYGRDGLGSPFDLHREFLLFQIRHQRVDEFPDEFVPVLRGSPQLFSDRLVSLLFKYAHGDILHLRHHVVQPQPVSQRGIDIFCLA